jgi:rubredoxin
MLTIFTGGVAIMKNSDKNSKAEMWAKYLRYLCEWGELHKGDLFYGMSPSCFEDWLCNERQEQGVCPKCGEASLDYDGGAVVEADYVYNWTCRNCGAVGKEHYSMTFEEHTLGEFAGKEVRK